MACDLKSYRTVSSSVFDLSRELVACLFAVLLASSLLSAAEENDSKPGAEQKNNDEESSRSRPSALRFRVLRRDTNQPAADAKVSVQMWGNGMNVNPTLTTDANGLATFEYPDGTAAVFLQATIKRPGFVPYYVFFGRGMKPAVLPTEKEIRLELGKTVGGTVVNEKGQPVSGVRVTISGPATDSPSQIHYTLFDTSTGDDGRWSMDSAPQNPAGLSVGLRHPQFIRTWGSVQDRTDGRYQLDPGLTLTGRVVDQAGNPIPDAQVTVGRDRWGSVESPTTVNPDGSFAVHALKPESTFVTVEAPTFSPQTKPIVISPSTQAVDFQLQPGKITRIHVVNTEGEPIQGVRVVADTWNTRRPLWWNARTDAQGDVTWDSAPEEPVKFHLLATGYAAERDAEFAPQDDPYTVVMLRPLRMEGIVTSTKNQKIPEFLVELGRKFGNQDNIHWMSHDSLSGSKGKFEVNYEERCDELFVKIEAKGFRPWISKGYTFEASPHRAFVKLEPAEAISVTVLTPQGSPASGVRLYRSTRATHLMFQEGYLPQGDRRHDETNDQGKVELPVPDEPTLFVAIHDSGFAARTGAELSSSPTIQLEAWAKVEVLVTRGEKALPNTVVEIYPKVGSDPKLSIISFGLTRTTDNEGRIVFPQVVPGAARILRVLPQSIGNGVMHHIAKTHNVNLKPGELTQVEFGKSGATVTGRIMMKGEAPAVHQWQRNQPAKIVLTLPKATGANGFLNSLAAGLTGQAPSQQGQGPQFLAMIAEDGTFAFDDIPPGKYTLQIDLTSVPKDDQFFSDQVIGKINQKIEIMLDQSTIDLGVIEGDWDRKLKKTN